MLAANLLSGCSLLDPLLNPVAPGVVTGVVLYNGEPAAGKPVTLMGPEKRAYTDASGRYTFSGVGGGSMRVRYDGISDRYNKETGRDDGSPNEVRSWVSAPFTLDGAGKQVSPFDVAYNGHLYPSSDGSFIVSDTQPIPFHWSTHRQAQKYRVKLSLRTNASATLEHIWTSGWTGDPTTVFAKSIAPGTYYWSVEIDGGERGTGQSRLTEVALGP
ncbi:hypothetical protein D3C72_1043630 [compost metagenome]